jgi:hypothetical protein
LLPIEKIWSKVKGLVRKAKACTTEAVWEAIARALEAVTPQDCQGCSASCGYHAAPECRQIVEAILAASRLLSPPTTHQVTTPRLTSATS